jgi:imidazolonepropionase-like amidohydrolase
MNKTFLIKGRVLDCTGSGPIEKGAVVVQKDQIKDVGRERDVMFPAKAKVIDASGSTIIPGLIDCHAHFCMATGAADTSYKDDFPPLKSYDIGKSTLYGVENAKRWIMAGVTTSRDIGCKHRGIFALREEIEAGRILGPRLVLAGRIVFQSGRRDSLGIQADGADEVRKVARQELGAGAEWIKVYASGAGTGNRPRDPWDIWMTYEEIYAACDEAHSKGMKAAAHAINAESAMRCIEAGIDSIEHGLLLNDDVLKAMKKNNVYYCPTIFTYYIDGEHALGEGKFTEQEAWIKERLLKEELPMHKQNVRRAAEMGVNIVVGTDIPHPIEEGNLIRADATAQELMLLVKYGLTPMYALRAGTQIAAKMLGMEDRIGTLQKGKLADLVVVDGNPLENMSALLPGNIQLVMKGGKIYQQQAFF